MSSPKRGRPCTFPVIEVGRLLTIHKEAILVDGNVVGKKNQIWNDLSAALNSIPGLVAPVSSAHLYVAVKEDRYQLLTSLLHPDGSCHESSGKEETSDSTSTTSKSDVIDNISQPSSEGDISGNSGILTFNLVLSRSDWNSIRPEKVDYRDKKTKRGRRTYSQLKRKAWTHVVNSHFWKNTRLPCKLTYTGGRVAKSDALHAVTIRGVCTFCNSIFHGYMSKLPEEGEVIKFICSYKGNFAIAHPKGMKRKLAGEALQKTLKKVNDENMSSTGFHWLEADRLMTAGDPEPSHLPSASQVRHAKSKSLKESHVDNNPIVALGEAMHQSRCKNIIHDLAYDKFSVSYHSSTQLHVYREFSKNNFPISVSIDATGGLVKKIQRAPGVKSGHIFLYSMVLRDKKNNKIYPACNLLSERHDTETLRHWLAAFLRFNVPPPNEVVIDMSLALMSACVQAFTTFHSLEAYCKRCAELLDMSKGEMNVEIPRCFIRNDVAHVIKLITTWSCFKNCIKITKQFFIRSLCQVLQCCNIKDVYSILEHIITVATSPTEGVDDNGQPTPCEISKAYLVQKIGGLVSEKDESAVHFDYGGDEVDEVLFKRSSNKERNSFHTMVKNIVERVESRKVTGSRGNQQFLPEVVKFIVQISPLIPMWTAIMVPIFGYGGVTATSTAVETYFQILKNITFRHKTLPMRVDDFVFNHIPSIEGAMKVATDKMMGKHIKDDDKIVERVETNSLQNKNEEVTVIDDKKDGFLERVEESKEVENWRGLGIDNDCMERKPSSYLAPKTEYSVCDLSKTCSIENVGNLKNGNLFQLKPLLVEGERIILSNTCAFDSLTQLYSTAFSDSPNFRSTLRHSTLTFFDFVRGIVQRGISRKTYTQRGKILMNIFQPVCLLEGMKKVPCETGVSPLASQLLRLQPTVTEENKCTSVKCSDKKRSYGRVPLSVYINSQKDLHSLNQMVDKELCSKKSKCAQTLKITEGYAFKCSGERRISKTLHEHLLLEPIQVEGNEGRLLQCLLRARELPTNLLINEKQFYLRGCIAYIGSDNLNDIGHYVAYARRTDGSWETYDDLVGKKLPYATKDIVKCHLILYTI